MRGRRTRGLHGGWRASGALAVAVALSVGASGCSSVPRGAVDVARGDSGWVGTWAAAPQLTEPRNMPPDPGLRGSTLRQIVRVSLGGSRVRVRVSNEFGNGQIVIGGARIAPSLGGGRVDPASTRPLTFSGEPHVTIPAGSAATSDPVAFDLRPLSDVAVTMFLSEVPSNLTGHPGSRTTSYFVSGDHVDEADLSSAVRTEHWYVLAGLEVERARGSVVVVLGNSIADGRGSGIDRQNRWPDNLARRLQQDARTTDVGVLNAGIGGNCVLRFCIGPSALERLDRDVLRQSGVRWLIVAEGVNDIGGARSRREARAVAEALIGGYRRIISRAHDRGVRVLGATILPFAGSQYDSPEREEARQRVNAWIREGGAFDGVIDFDLAMRDPAQPTRLRRDVDGGDHLHPNEYGYRVMADAVDLTFLIRAGLLENGVGLLSGAGQ